MATALDVLNIARSQIGFKEGLNNANPYGIWYGIPNAPYCAMGVSWCFAQVGASNLIAAQTPKGFSFNPVALHWFQMQGMVVNKMSMTTGDLVFYDWNGDGVADHVELCEAASPGGFTTIAFNTGNPNDPTQEGCWRVHRNYLFVIAVVRPRYPQPVKPTTGINGSKKATATVAATGTAIAGGTAAMHPATTNTTPAPTPSPTVFVAPAWPKDPSVFVIGAKNNYVLTIEKGLQKLGLLPPKYADGVMDVNTVNALTKFEQQNPVLGAKNGAVNELAYNVLKAQL